MNMTRTAATITHMVFTLDTVSPSDGPSAASAAPGTAREASTAIGPARKSLVDIGFLLVGAGGATPPDRVDQGTNPKVRSAGPKIFSHVSRIRAAVFSHRSIVRIVPIGHLFEARVA